MQQVEHQLADLGAVLRLLLKVSIHRHFAEGVLQGQIDGYDNTADAGVSAPTQQKVRLKSRPSVSHVIQIQTHQRLTGSLWQQCQALHP